MQRESFSVPLPASVKFVPFRSEEANCDAWANAKVSGFMQWRISKLVRHSFKMSDYLNYSNYNLIADIRKPRNKNSVFYSERPSGQLFGSTTPLRLDHGNRILFVLHYEADQLITGRSR